ncbi:hypothetical protein B0H13DRAFT_2513015 [Mycena leptocephala]|nr:hypothetical protein B0H13DRAFT_2513015 [Mycena leptocephala]
MSGLHPRKRHTYTSDRDIARDSPPAAAHLHRAHDCSSAARRTDVCQALHLLRTALHRYLPAFDTTLHHRDGTPSCCIVIETSSSGAGPQAGQLPPSGNGSASPPARLAYTSSSAGRCIARGDMRIPHRAHDYIPALRSASSMEVCRALCYSPPRAMLPICICVRTYSTKRDAFTSLSLARHVERLAVGEALGVRAKGKGPFPIHASPQRILLRVSTPLPPLRYTTRHPALALASNRNVCRVQTQLAPLLAATQAVLAALVAHMVPPSPLPRIVFILDPPARRSSHPPSKNLPESGKGMEIKHVRWTHLSYIEVGSPDVLDATTGCGPAGKGVSQRALAAGGRGRPTCSSILLLIVRLPESESEGQAPLPRKLCRARKTAQSSASGSEDKSSRPATRYPPSLTVSLSRKLAEPVPPKVDDTTTSGGATPPQPRMHNPAPSRVSRLASRVSHSPFYLSSCLRSVSQFPEARRTNEINAPSEVLHWSGVRAYAREGSGLRATSEYLDQDERHETTRDKDEK